MTGVSETMKEALTHFQMSGDFGKVRRSTITGLERRGMIQATTEGYTLTVMGTRLVVG